MYLWEALAQWVNGLLLPGVITQRSQLLQGHQSHPIPPCRELWACPAGSFLCQQTASLSPCEYTTARAPLETLGCTWEAAKQQRWDEELSALFVAVLWGYHTENSVDNNVWVLFFFPLPWYLYGNFPAENCSHFRHLFWTFRHLFWTNHSSLKLECLPGRIPGLASLWTAFAAKMMWNSEQRVGHCPHPTLHLWPCPAAVLRKKINQNSRC